MISIRNILGAFGGVLRKTMIPLAFVGCEMFIANLYPTRARGIIVLSIYHTSEQCFSRALIG